jgi:hypothetical protein
MIQIAQVVYDWVPGCRRMPGFTQVLSNTAHAETIILDHSWNATFVGLAKMGPHGDSNRQSVALTK